MALFHTTVLDNQIKALPTVDTASGAIASFNTDLTENLVEVKCQIVAKQASGTPSPVNPLPIQTYTEMNVSATGKNFINVPDTTVSTANYVFNYKDLNIPKGEYTFSYDTDYSGGMSFAVGGDNGDYYNSAISGVKSINVPDKITKIRLYASGAGTFSNIQLEKGSTRTTFEPFNGTTSNIPFGQTVANGLLDITTGKLRVTWYDVDLGSLSWTRKTDGAIPYFRHDFTDSSLTQLNRAFVCSNYPNVAFSDIYTNGQDKASSSYSGGIFIISDTDYSDATAFTTAMSGVQLIYELATPIEIQLDSITLQALLNENNIWCDTGDTEVKFLLSVGKKIS